MSRVPLLLMYGSIAANKQHDTKTKEAFCLLRNIRFLAVRLRYGWPASASASGSDADASWISLCPS